MKLYATFPILVVVLVEYIEICHCYPINEFSLAQIFEENEVVPDSIPVAPKELLKVTYSCDVEVKIGKELTPFQVRNMPENVKWNSDPADYYTLIMTEPDVPSRCNRSLSQVLHWLVGNIPGKDVASGETIAEYFPIAPPLGFGIFRYVFLVYKQPCLITFTEPKLNITDVLPKLLFSPTALAKKYNMGDPIAGNFFYAHYSDYVPIILVEIGFEP